MRGFCIGHAVTAGGTGGTGAENLHGSARSLLSVSLMSPAAPAAKSQDVLPRLREPAAGPGGGSGAALNPKPCIPRVSSLRLPALVAMLQGSILTFVSLRLDWAAEARRAAALMASHTTLARDIEAAPLRPGKASLEDELDA